MEEQQTYQSKKEIRRQKKENERREGQKRYFKRRFRNYAVVFLIIAALGFGIYILTRSAAPKEKDFSRAIPNMGETHIEVGGAFPEYNSNPPTSGPHYSQTARSGFREAAIDDRYIIHNLEHGDIWIAYHPRVSDEIKEQLNQFGAAKVIITPREANDAYIALAACGRLDAFNLENNILPVRRVDDFIKRYSSKGPERVPGASGGI